MKGVHKEILQLVYYTKGGFTWSEVYNEIPVPLRRFYLRELEKMMKEEKEEAKSSAKSGSSQSKTNIPNSVKQAMKKGK